MEIRAVWTEVRRSNINPFDIVWQMIVLQNKSSAAEIRMFNKHLPLPHDDFAVD